MQEESLCETSLNVEWTSPTYMSWQARCESERNCLGISKIEIGAFVMMAAWSVS